MMPRIKRAVLPSLLHVCRAYLQNACCDRGKAWLWRSICTPHLAWRDVEVICRTEFGCRMRARPCQFIENRILFFGVWEPNVSALFRSLVGRGDVVIDVGANVGYYTLLSSRLVGPEGRVFAVEPSMPTRARLEGNLELNSVRNTVVLPIAAWDKEDHAILNYDIADAGGSSLRPLGKSSPMERVRLRPLDDVIPPEDVQRISLIKIDIEGAELHALRGLVRILNLNRRLSIIVEVNSTMLHGMGSSAGAMLEFLNSNGFVAHQIPNSYEPAAYIPPRALEPPSPVSGALPSPSYALFTRDEAFAAAR